MRLLPIDRIAHPVDDVLMDYVLTPYPPRADPTGRLHSTSLLRYFLRSHHMMAAWPIITRLREHLGSGQTVWGIKRDAAGRVGIELYFYNHCGNAPGGPMSVTTLCGVLADLIDIPDRVQRGDFVLRLSEGVNRANETLRQYVVEEAHEVVDAIDQGTPEILREELGDLLLQVVFQVIEWYKARFS